MKDGVVLVNTSRGGLVKTEDLIAGIRARKFYAVGLMCMRRRRRMFMKTGPMKYWSIL